MQNILFYVFERETFVHKVSLRYFAMLCNNDECKKMGQDQSLGQLYVVHNEIKISTKALVGPTLLLRHKLDWLGLKSLKVS